MEKSLLLQVIYLINNSFNVVGVFYQLVSGKIGSERLQEIIGYLSEGSQNEEIKKIIKVFKKWGKENGYNFSDQIAFEGAY